MTLVIHSLNECEVAVKLILNQGQKVTYETRDLSNKHDLLCLSNIRAVRV